MPHTSHSFVHRARPVRQNSMLTRICIGLLGLFPLVTAAVMTIIPILPIALVIAGLGAVTIMSLLPRGDRRRS